MTQEELVQIQSRRGARLLTNDSVSIDYSNAERKCRDYIESKASEYRDLDPLKKKEAIKNAIVEYVMNFNPMVRDFMDVENTLDSMRLIDALTQSILDYGKLTFAIENPEIYEIRANGKELKVEINGRNRDLYDKDGNIVSFDSPEEQEIIIKKLLGDVKLSPKDKIVNGRTLEGYRIAAIHRTAMSADPDDPAGNKYHSFVLRKFKKQKMTLGEIARKKTFSDNMGRLLSLCPQAGLVFFTVGPTASGKTTTNNAILQCTPSNIRVILIQNPSEIDLRFKDEDGRVYNDVLHLEAQDFENPSPNDNTMANLMDAALRLSPVLVCIGETRTDEEFKLLMKILLAGHPANATYHSDSGKGAVQRFLTAYTAGSNTSTALALNNIVTHVDLIIVQKIYRDGYRRIKEISEVVGVDENNPELPKLNTLYVFEETDDPVYDSDGNLELIVGEHKRIHALSDRLLKKFKEEGIQRDRYEFLLKEPEKTEIETYTGKNIDKTNRH